MYAGKYSISNMKWISGILIMKQIYMQLHHMEKSRLQKPLYNNNRFTALCPAGLPGWAGCRYQLNSTQLNEHLWTQVLKQLNVHIYLATISYRYY